MTDKERIEEIHGLWELAVTNVAALARSIVLAAGDHGDMHLPREKIDALADACREEQELLGLWQRTTVRAIENCEPPPVLGWPPVEPDEETP